MRNKFFSRYMLQELNQAICILEVGLSMNFKKTKIMCNKHAEDTNRKITIDNNEIEEVDHYIYLGGILIFSKVVYDFLVFSK